MAHNWQKVYPQSRLKKCKKCGYYWDDLSVPNEYYNNIETHHLKALKTEPNCK